MCILDRLVDWQNRSPLHEVSLFKNTNEPPDLGVAAFHARRKAAGRLDAYWATAVCPWDSAGGTVIVREAGATLSAYVADVFPGDGIVIHGCG